MKRKRAKFFVVLNLRGPSPWIHWTMNVPYRKWYFFLEKLEKRNVNT